VEALKQSQALHVETDIHLTSEQMKQQPEMIEGPEAFERFRERIARDLNNEIRLCRRPRPRGHEPAPRPNRRVRNLAPFLPASPSWSAAPAPTATERIKRQSASRASIEEARGRVQLAGSHACPRVPKHMHLHPPGRTIAPK